MRQFIKFFLYAVAVMTVTACSDDDSPSPGADVGADDVETITLKQQPTADEIKTFFHGKGFYGDVADNLIENYLKPRIGESTSDISDDDLDFVVLSDAYAAEIVKSQSEFDKVKALWNKKRAIAFIEPSKNSVELLEKLRSQDFDYESEITNEMVSDFSNIKLFVTVSGQKNYVLDKYTNPTVFQTEKTTIGENQSEEVTTTEEQVPVKMDGYHLGLIAEDLCSWLNKNVTVEDGSDPALVKASSSTDYTYGCSETDWTQKLSLTYSEVSEYNDPTFSSRTIAAKTHVKVTGAYCEADNSDIYDVEVLDKFPISEIYYQNYLLDEYGAVNYKDKYTGYCYTGPSVDLSMKNASGQILNSGVGIYSASPQAVNNDVSTTHYPMTASFGSSIAGSVSSDGPGLSVGLSSNFTLPYEATTYAYKEMKFNYGESDGTADWDYYHDGYWIYDWTWGFNGSFEYVYEQAKSDSDFSFMLTFKLADSQSYGEQNLYLNANLRYDVYSEVCKPKKHTRYRKYWGPINRSFLMPVVYRYFGKYSPSYYTATISATDDDWVNLKSLLEDNLTYRALSDDAISVGARTEKTVDGRNGVEAQAERIWIETMNSIIQQRNGHTYVEGEWVIGLYGQDAWLKKGLHIKDKTWEIVDDISLYDNLSPAN